MYPCLSINHKSSRPRALNVRHHASGLIQAKAYCQLLELNSKCLVLNQKGQPALVSCMRRIDLYQDLRLSPVNGVQSVLDATRVKWKNR
jgi:hypothetical protein